MWKVLTINSKTKIRRLRRVESLKRFKAVFYDSFVIQVFERQRVKQNATVYDESHHCTKYFI